MCVYCELQLFSEEGTGMLAIEIRDIKKRKQKEVSLHMLWCLFVYASYIYSVFCDVIKLCIRTCTLLLKLRGWERVRGDERGGRGEIGGGGEGEVGVTESIDSLPSPFVLTQSASALSTNYRLW